MLLLEGRGELTGELGNETGYRDNERINLENTIQTEVLRLDYHPEYLIKLL